MKTAATIESHRKALREILPFLILVVPCLLFIMLYLASLFDFNDTKNDNGTFSSEVGLFFSTPGLVTAVSFAFNLCLIRKNLKWLRSKKKTLGTNKSINQRHTHCTTVYTSERHTCLRARMRRTHDFSERTAKMFSFLLKMLYTE